jgi:hypothetical protein
MTIFSKSFPISLASRICKNKNFLFIDKLKGDCFVMEGEGLIYRAALGILKLHQTALLKADLEECMQLLHSFDMR